MAAFIMFWALYFLYDGYVGYPYKREIARQFAQFEKEDKTDQWQEYALERGWPDGLNGPPGHAFSDWDIRTQLIIGYLLLPWSVLMWVSLLRLIGRRIESDQAGLTASWGWRQARLGLLPRPRAEG